MRPSHRARAGAGLLILLAACGSPVARPAAHVARRSTATPAPTPTPVPTPPPLAAPLIVQVENSPEARPQSGLQAADIVYEYVTEGGITRFSAFFFHPPGVVVGPVRSARIATVQMVQIYGAALLYSGAGAYVEGQLNAAQVPHFNETSAAGDAFRIRARFAPHNLYTDGSHIGDLMQRIHLQPVGYQLWPRSDPATVPGGRPTAGFTVPLSTFEAPAYAWRPDLHAFVRIDTNGILIDADSAQPVAASTVVVMQVDVSPAPEVHDVTGAIGTRHVLQGTGQAQIFTGGAEFDATWTQGASGPPQFVLPGGAAAPIAPGIVWICLVPRGVLAPVR